MLHPTHILSFFRYKFFKLSAGKGIQPIKEVQA